VKAVPNAEYITRMLPGEVPLTLSPRRHCGAPLLRGRPSLESVCCIAINPNICRTSIRACGACCLMAGDAGFRCTAARGTKEDDMSLITALVTVAALFAAVSLFEGIASMAHGGVEDERKSVRLMFRRVGWQALAFLFVLIALIANLK
jgi:hypothetical protein